VGGLGPGLIWVTEGGGGRGGEKGMRHFINAGGATIKSSPRDVKSTAGS
jgi:hypothetical protein